MICPSCGLEVQTGEACPHHFIDKDRAWAEANRIMCAFFHRGIAPPRLSETERFDTNIPNTPADTNVTPFVYDGIK